MNKPILIVIIIYTLLILAIGFGFRPVAHASFLNDIINISKDKTPIQRLEAGFTMNEVYNAKLMKAVNKNPKARGMMVNCNFDGDTMFFLSRFPLNCAIDAISALSIMENRIVGMVNNSILDDSFKKKFYWKYRSWKKSAKFIQGSCKEPATETVYVEVVREPTEEEIEKKAKEMILQILNK